MKTSPPLLCVVCGCQIPERRGLALRCRECRSRPRLAEVTPLSDVDWLDQARQLYFQGGIPNVMAGLYCSQSFAHHMVRELRLETRVLPDWAGVCVICGVSLNPGSRKPPKFCADCKAVAWKWQRHRDGLAIRIRWCRCGQSFLDWGPGTFKHCHICAAIAYTANQKRRALKYKVSATRQQTLQRREEQKMLEQAMRQAWTELHPKPPKERKARKRYPYLYQRRIEPAFCGDCGVPVRLPARGRPGLRCRTCKNRHKKACYKSAIRFGDLLAKLPDAG